MRQNVNVLTLEENEIFRRLLRCILFQRVIDSVLVGGALKSLDVAVGYLDVVDCGVLLNEVLDRLFSAINLRLRVGLLGFLDFLQELFQSLFKRFSRDLAAFDGESDCFVVYFILHTSSFRAFWQRPQGLCTARLTKVTFR